MVSAEYEDQFRTVMESRSLHQDSVVTRKVQHLNSDEYFNSPWQFKYDTCLACPRKSRMWR